MPGEECDWSRVLRDAAGFPYVIGHAGPDVIIQVAATAPRGIIRLSPGLYEEHETTLHQAGIRARAHEAADSE